MQEPGGSAWRGAPATLMGMPDRMPIEGFTAIIPAGGVGSRLWPLSRTGAPKFLLDLTGSGTSLLRETWDRLLPIAGADHVVVVTGRSHASAVAAQLPELLPANMLIESEPRESTAAIGLAAAILERRSPGMIIGSFAADHVIAGGERFANAVRTAVDAARSERIVAIGIRPTEPATGFGYLQTGAAIDPAVPEVLAVSRFVEKPDQATAEQYLATGGYLWNAGMFIARARVLLDWIREHNPRFHAGLLRIAAAWEGPERTAVLEREWPRLAKIAIDYAVAEPAAASGAMAVVPAEFDWDDVGDFAALARLRTGGRAGELAVLGDPARVLSEGSSGVVVSESGRLIAVAGLEDIVVVDTPDALLVTTVEHAQRVKALVEALKQRGGRDVL